MNYQLGRELYARIYGCTPRSIGNYEREDAPLDDPAEMYQWLWKRRTQPASFGSKSVEEIIKAYDRATANAEEREAILCEEITDTVFEIDVRQLIIRCKLLAAEKEGRLPEFGPRAFDALNIILDQVKVLYALVGADRDAQWNEGEIAGEEEDDDAEEEPGVVLISRTLEPASI